MIAARYHPFMAQVLVRDLDDQIVSRLKVLAKAQNISLEQKFRDMAAREVQEVEDRFERVAARIREQGVPVYGFGERKTPESFRQACTRFIYTENLTGRAAAEAPVDEGDAPGQVARTTGA